MTGLRVAGAIALAASAAAAHEHGAHADWLRSLMQPSGASCCHDKDCAATDAWRLAGERYDVMIAGQWRPVPPERVITHRGNPIGRAVLCVQAEQILCFVPGTMG